MPLPKNIQTEIYNYCSNHLPSEEWYDEEFADKSDAENLGHDRAADFGSDEFSESVGLRAVFQAAHRDHSPEIPPGIVRCCDGTNTQ